MLAKLITVAALGVFVARCLLLLVRTAMTGHRTRYVALVKRYVFTVATLCAQTRRAVVRLHNLIAEQMHVLVLAADNRLLSRCTREPGSDLRSWWPWWWRHGYHSAQTVRPGSCEMGQLLESCNDPAQLSSVSVGSLLPVHDLAVGQPMQIHQFSRNSGRYSAR